MFEGILQICERKQILIQKGKITVNNFCSFNSTNDCLMRWLREFELTSRDGVAYIQLPLAALKHRDLVRTVQCGW